MNKYKENWMSKIKTADRLKDLPENAQGASHYHRRRNSMILLPQIATTSWRAWNALKWNPMEANERGREGNRGYLNPEIGVLTEKQSCWGNVLEVMECRFKDHRSSKGQMSSKRPHWLCHSFLTSEVLAVHDESSDTNFTIALLIN